MKQRVKVSPKLFADLAKALMNDPTAVRVTKYLSDKLTIKATRPVYRRRTKHQRKKSAKRTLRDDVLTIRFTVGPPNYQERVFIRDCKHAGEPFPVRKLQYQHLKQR
jgi:hypothetical protein